MKRILTIFLAAFFVFAQDETQTDGSEVLQAQIDTAQQIAETTEEADTTAEIAGETADTAVARHRIFFMGVQTGDIPELRATLEDMVRTRWGSTENIDFVNPNISARVIRKLFYDGRIVIDPSFFDELEKNGLQNTIVLLINIDEYSVKPVRRLIIGAGVEGKLKADFLFYDAATGRQLFAAKLSSVSLVKKTPIFWRSVSERVVISADDLKKINSDLLNDIVRQGFETMKIAVSSKK